MSRVKKQTLRLLELYFKIRETQGQRAIQINPNSLLFVKDDDPYKLIDSVINVSHLLFQMVHGSGKIHRRYHLSRLEWAGLQKVLLPTKTRQPTRRDYNAYERALDKCCCVFEIAGLIEEQTERGKPPKMDFSRTKTGALKPSITQLIKEMRSK